MAEVELTKGYTTVVDDGDLPVMGGFRWKALTVSGKVYAARTNPSGSLDLLHRLIVNAPKGIEVDHINGDGLDNRRANLRLATRQQNAWNIRADRGGSSRYRGVHWSKKDRKWVAQMSVGSIGGKQARKYLGQFDDEVQAAMVYDSAVLEMRGEYAVTNFPVKKGPHYKKPDFTGLLP